MVRRISGGLLARVSLGGSTSILLASASGQMVARIDDQAPRIATVTTPGRSAASAPNLSTESFTGSWYLSFPLNSSAMANKINTVFDHHTSTPYQYDREVTAYNGEQGGLAECGSALACKDLIPNTSSYGWAKSTSPSSLFSVNGQYTGGGDAHYLYYEGHPGFDYQALCNQLILAPASGSVFVPSDDYDEPKSRFNTFAIDHGNGYSTWFLHALIGSEPSPGAPVARGDPIAQVGNTGLGLPSCIGKHLHFELRKNVNGTWVPVDPYGWSPSSKNDPYSAATSVNMWTPSGTKWVFDTEGNTKGWTPFNFFTYKVSDGMLQMEPRGIDPYFESPPLVNILASDYDTVTVTMRSTAADGNGKIYFRTDLAGWSEMQSVPFNVSNDGVARSYSVYMATAQGWAGHVTAIRVDPAVNGNLYSSAQLQLGISSVELTATSCRVPSSTVATKQIPPQNDVSRSALTCVSPPPPPHRFPRGVHLLPVSLSVL